MRAGKTAHVLAIALLLAACDPANPPTGVASPAGTPSSLASAAAGTATLPSAMSSPAATAPSPSSGPSEAATPLPTDPALKIDPAAVLQVCSPFDANGTRAIDCADGVALAYSALGADAPRAARADLRFDCPGCPARSPSRAYVSFWGPGLSVRITVVSSDADGLRAVEAASAGPAPAAPAFTAPPSARPAVPRAPAWVSRRAAYALCGDETAPMGGPFDTAARTCFLDGVLAGARVEFIVRSNDMEGGDFIEIDRYGGDGGITSFIMTDGQWTAYRSGISELGDGQVFARDGVGLSFAP